MRSTALAYPDERDEVPMSSQEVLEANVAAIRGDLNELKTDLRAAVARLDQRIDAAVSRLETEIRAMGAKAEKELEEFAGRIEKQIEEMPADDTQRDRIDDNQEELSGKIDKNHETLNVKIDKNYEAQAESPDLGDWRIGNHRHRGSGGGESSSLVLTNGAAFFSPHRQRRPRCAICLEQPPGRATARAERRSAGRNAAS
jgi:hypothetical protein